MSNEIQQHLILPRSRVVLHRLSGLFFLLSGVLLGGMLVRMGASSQPVRVAVTAGVLAEFAFAVLMAIPPGVIVLLPRGLRHIDTGTILPTVAGFGFLFLHATAQLTTTVFVLHRSATVDLLSDLSKLTGTVVLVWAGVKWVRGLRRSVEEARDTVQRLSIATQAANLGIWQVNYSAGRLEADERMCAIFGRSRGAFFPSVNEWLSALPKDSALVLQDALTAARTRGEPIDIDMEIGPPGADRERIVRCIGQCIPDEQGRVTGVLGTCEDVTRRVQESRARSLEEARFRGLFEHAPIGIAMNDYETGAFLEFNAAINEPAGYTEEEFRKLSYWDVTPKKYMQAEQQQLALMEKQGYYGPFEKEYIRKDGSRYPVLLHGIKISDPSGRDVIWSFIQDISALKEAQSAVAESELRFQQIADTIPVVFWIRTPEQMLYINSAYESVWGRSRESLYANPFSFVEAVHEEDRDRVIQALQQEFGDKGYFHEEYRIVRPDGDVRWVRASSHPVFDERGNIIRSAGTALDVTEIRNAREAAEQASRVKGEFIANMSHEIRTPINVVLGMTTVLSDTSLTSWQQDCIEKIGTSSRHLLGIINDILDYSKIEAGKLQLEKTTFLVADLFEQLRVLFSQAAAEKDVRLLFDVRPDVPVALEGDSMRLKQILINLLGNAVKFTDAGTVLLKMQQETKTADAATFLITVTDTGIGMSEAVQQSVFQAFEQADMSTTRKYGGTGLGLVITKSLVELMDGSIDLVSTPGEGSTFTVRLPLHVNPKIRIAQVCPDLSGTRVLVVCADETERIIVRDMLDSCGLDVVVAARVPDEMTTGVNCVLVDVDTPDQLFSRDALRDLQSMSAEVPVVLVSSYNRDTLEGRIPGGLPVGYNEVLTKPITKVSLNRVLVRVLRGDTRSDRLAESTQTPALSGKTILVVEDQDMNRDVLNLFLEPTAATVLNAVHGKEAVDLVRGTHVDLVLMDLQMPELDGYEATRHLRQTGFDRPILALTAAARSDDVTRVLREGMNGHLAKPIERDVLYASLTRWLGDSSLPESTSERQHTPSEHRVSMPDIPGFDTDLGLRRYDGDETFYRKQLARFRDAVLEQYAALPGLLVSGDLTQSAQLSHNLKGTAGAVAAVRLQDLAARINSSAGAGEVVDPMLRQELVEALDEAGRHLTGIGSSSSAAHHDRSANAPDDDIMSVLKTVRSRLVHNEYLEDDLVDRALGYLSQSGDQHQCRELRESMERYDTGKALELLYDITRKQGIILV